MGTQESVSYTHLDVYKRQVVTLIEPALSPVCCGSSLSELSSVAVSVICYEPLASFFADLITKNVATAASACLLYTSTISTLCMILD